MVNMKPPHLNELNTQVQNITANTRLSLQTYLAKHNHHTGSNMDLN